MPGKGITRCHIVCLLLLLQFLFRFSQGQGPGHTFTVTEEQPEGTEVGTIGTRTGYTYEFSDQGATAYFTLDRNSGLIVTAVRLDREALSLPENKFNFLILEKSSSGAPSSMAISIQVLDINDNSPKFFKDEYYKDIPEGKGKNGTDIWIRDATDDDFGINAEITEYRIVSGDGPFQLLYDPDAYANNIVIRVTADELDREAVDSYTLTISAHDSGSPQRSGTTVVHIKITDINDNPPVFDPSTYNAKLNETDEVGTFVIQTIASDVDIGVNKDIAYSFFETNEYIDQFRIDERTGEIFTTKKPLICPGNCRLTVIAKDGGGGSPSYTARAFVFIFIVVEDTNDHDPQITITFLPRGTTNNFSTVDEGAPDGTEVAGIQVTDADSGRYGETSIQIVSGNELQHFRIWQFLSYILVIVNGDGVLDRERYDQYNLTIEARDNGVPPRITVQAFLIHVNDVNDHAPVFGKSNYRVELSETLPGGTFVESLLAKDGDTGINAKLTYKILTGNEKNWFEMNPDTGLVTTRARLHYEQTHNFQMNVSVTDGGIVPRSDYAELVIALWDENDIAPTFSSSTVEVQLEENVMSGAPVASLSADDKDTGLNGTVTYQFHPDTVAQYPQTFHINTNTGSVTTTRPLDREDVAFYTLKVIAKDSGSHPLSSTATVHLRVLDKNDNSPVFYPTKYFATVLENGPSVVDVATVSATDKDEGDNAKVTYSVFGSDYDSFAVDPSSGHVTTTKSLSKLSGSSYTLTVSAADKSGVKSSSTATVSIMVITPSDLRPYFTDTLEDPISIWEDVASEAPNIGGVVIRVNARVDSFGTSIFYTIAAGDPAQHFNLDRTTGSITRNRIIDREETPEFSLTVVASTGTQFTSMDIKIIVKDRNDNPPVFASPSLIVDVVENWPEGHFIKLILASDADQGVNARVTYTLKADANNVFAIQRDTGVLYLNKPVSMLADATTPLVVTATDSGTSQLSASQNLLIRLQDVNNHTPHFAQSKYEMSLVESHTVNDRFFQVVARDDDVGDNGKVIYNITSGNENSMFGIFPDGYLYVARELDRETKDLYKLTVVARDKGMEPRSSECNITIHVTDENDNKPFFINGTYHLSVLENKRIGSSVGFIRARDLDVDRNAELSYFLDEDEKDFAVDATTGLITTLKKIDREVLANQSYTFTFDATVKDNGVNRLQDIATVRVTILDENDNEPVFEQNPYVVSVPENAAIFANVTVVKATDPDAGINGIVTYKIDDGNEENKFEIHPTTGQITLKRILDRETDDRYLLKISCTDSGTMVQHTSSTEVLINVLDINDNTPLFAQTSMEISVPEDTSRGKLVAQYSATDVDLSINGHVWYSVSGADNSNDTFGIDKHTGAVYVLKSLDYELINVYNLNVMASDYGSPPLSFTVRLKIKVQDVNDNHPVFPPGKTSFRVRENSSGSVGIVTASDADSDENGEIKYEIYFQDPPGQNFKIVALTGEIYVSTPVDREVTGMYNLTVVATDQAQPPTARLSSEKLVYVFIDDVNDNYPVITSMNAIKIPLSTSTNSQVTTLQVHDPDADGNGQVALQLVEGSRSLFLLESSGGFFMTADTLPSSPVTYNLKVQATDYGSPYLSKNFTFTVIITNSDAGPQFERKLYDGAIAENSSVGKSILKVKATSTIEGSRVEYYITKVTDAATSSEVGRHFQVDKSTGVVSPAVILDRETMGENFLVEICAVDMTGDKPRTTTIEAQIQVLDENDTPPAFSSTYYTFSVQEDVPPSSVVARVTVTDGEQFGGLYINISSGNDGSLLLQQNGDVLTTRLLDRETRAQYNLRIKATDGVQSSFALLRLNLQDVNDNPPRFDQAYYSFDVPEDTPVGTIIGVIRAEDGDEGVNGQVSYSFTSSWASETFQLDSDTGILTLINAVDFEQDSLYSLILEARDGGDPAKSSSVSVWINVKDVNDNAPLFVPASYDREVYENVGVGVSLLQVFATDIDSGVNGEVYYSLPRTVGEQFRIDEDDGTIYCNQSLDRETTPSYSFTVYAMDKAVPSIGRKTAEATVSISLKDVNDYTPQFISPSTVMVKENTAQNTAVHTVVARDLDAGANGEVEYDIVTTSGGYPFTLGRVDGKLRVHTDLDREVVQNYTMVIRATDQGSSPLSATQTLVVKLQDENDNSPVFSPEFYEYTLKEDIAIGSTLLQVTATDIDEGLNGIVRYFIIGGDSNFDFSIDQSSGLLRVQKSLDFERVQSYNLTIQAEDSGGDLKSATTTVSISVQDVNDNEPFFLNSPYTGFVQENRTTAGVHVLQVSARDADSAPFNDLHYYIREGDQSLFNLSVKTGEIMALRTLDREERSQHHLVVIAKDSASGQAKTGLGTVTIFVEDINDNPPVFENPGVYVVHVTENAPEDTEIITVKATDLDEGVNAQIIYSLKESAGDRFTIYPDTGLITTTVSLDREAAAEYQLEVLAQDASMLPLSATTTVMVYVDDVNDNKPTFDLDHYSASVLLPADSGVFVMGVTAVDKDVGNNGLVHYTMSTTADASFFRIDALTGVITAAQSLTSGQTYQLQVMASDKGIPAETSEVSVTVQVATVTPSNLPVFNQIPSGLTVAENSAKDDTVTTVTASIDNGVQPNYYIVGGNTNNAFSVDATTGRVFVSGVVDYEMAPTYHLWVQAREPGAAQAWTNAELVLQIQDINDNFPRFSQLQYHVNVSEDASFGHPLLTVTATDADSGANGAVRYSLAGEDAGAFRIMTNGGLISVFTDLDRETKDLYRLLILAADNGATKHTSTASLQVSILDVNDNSPKFSRVFSVKIPEDLQVGSFVLRVTSTDADIGDNAKVTYLIKDDAGGVFALDGLSGNITLQKPLDAEVKDSYRLRISASDGENYIEGNVEVKVTDINDNSPIMRAPFTFSIPEQQPVGYRVGVLSAKDADKTAPNNQTYFSLKLPSTYFHLNSENGSITSLQEMEYHYTPDHPSPANRHELVVQVKDLGTPSRSTEVTIYINVVDYNNHAPEFLESSYVSAVPVNAQADDTLLTVLARDDYDYGINAEVEYFVAGGTGSEYIKVDRTSGVVKVAKTLLLTPGTQLDITVEARDRGTPPQSSTVQVQLMVTDVNRFAPTFVLPPVYETTIPEDTASGVKVTTFSATDRDSGLNGEVVYAIVAGNDEGLFRLDAGGILTVNDTLDYETTQQHTLKVSARDRALLFKEAEVMYVINLSDVDDNNPVFKTEKDHVSIEENSPPETPVYQAIATDADTGNNAVIQYALVGDSQAQAVFDVNSISGLVTLKGQLDYESKKSYTLTIMSLNPIDSPRKSTMTLTVDVLGVNEFVPRCEKPVYYFSVNESDGPGTVVDKILAIDNDDGEDGIVYYFLIGESNQKGFKIDHRTGQITVSGKLDYESSNRITLNILVKNWGSVKGDDIDTCIVNIALKNTNDAPEFTKDIYRTHVVEGSNADVSVVTVTAMDYDAKPEDREFSYRILMGNEEDLFQIGSTSGLVTTTGRGTLDRDRRPVYNITVGAVDTGARPQTGTAMVEIHVCPASWSGQSCEDDVDECQEDPCLNGATCENLPGSFVCHCRDGFSNTLCQDGVDHCLSSPCQHGICRNTEGRFECSCPYGYWGNLCQYQSRGFGVGSYLEFDALNDFDSDIEVIFATNKHNALLLYNPVARVGSSEFIALEILNSHIQFSVAMGTLSPAKITIAIDVATGNWFKAKVDRNGSIYSVRVAECPEDGSPCQECRNGAPCHGTQDLQSDKKPDIGSYPLSIGGIRDMNSIVARGYQVKSHDFVGCIRSFLINGIDKLQTVPQRQAGVSDQCPRSTAVSGCTGLVCENGGTCLDEWAGPVCRCGQKYAGTNCKFALNPFGFSPDTLVKITPKESYRRDQIVAAGRSRRATTESSVMIRFRTTAENGLLLLVSTVSGSKYSALAILNGHLKFTAGQYGASNSTLLPSPTVNDGSWHNATVTVTGTSVTLDLDGQHKAQSDSQVFGFSDLDVKQLSLGGATGSITIDNTALKDFDGCISELEVDDTPIPMNGSTNSYVVQPVGGVENGCSALCAGNPCNGGACSVAGEVTVCGPAPGEEGPLSIGVIVVIVFFAVLIIVIIVVFIVFRLRGQTFLCLKKNSKLNGLAKSANSSGHSNQDSGFGENNIDQIITSNYIQQELRSSGHRGRGQNGHLMRPDIIESETTRSPLPLEMEDGTVIIDNASDLTHLRDLNGDIPEHYDLENASSIAPSDVDFVDHYRHFHNPSKPRKKSNKTHSSHSSRPSHQHSNHSSSHHRHDSPAALTSVPYMNDLTRTSPAMRNSPINQLSRQSPHVRNSPLTHVNMRGLPVTELNVGSGAGTSEHSLASHQSKHSSNAPHKPKRQMLPNGNANKQHAKGPGTDRNTPSNGYENKQFLTLDQVNHLNSRPRESPASLLEAVSSSSENNARKAAKPAEQYRDTNILLDPAPLSSSEDSANDSFTCSEFEFENEKPRNDFDPSQKIFSNLAEVENENDDGAYHNRTFKPDGLDSGGNSFSSNVGSSDEGLAKTKPINGTFNWDDLLNWGPKFEKLVGVFTDIALLPDGDNIEIEDVVSKPTDQEEYV